MTFWLGLIVGLIVGANIGAMLMAVCAMGKDAESETLEWRYPYDPRRRNHQARN